MLDSFQCCLVSHVVLCSVGGVNCDQVFVLTTQQFSSKIQSHCLHYGRSFVFHIILLLQLINNNNHNSLVLILHHLNHHAPTISEI